MKRLPKWIVELKEGEHKANYLLPSDIQRVLKALHIAWKALDDVSDADAKLIGLGPRARNAMLEIRKLGDKKCD